MKKYLFALASLAFLMVACQKPKEEPTPEEPKDETPAQLVSFKLLASDNAGFTEDYSPETIAESMIIRVPGGGMGKTLTATLTAGENDVIKVNEKEVSGGKASFDASFPVDILVTNSKSGKSAQYEVKIGKILQVVTKKLGVALSSGEMVYTGSSFKTAVNPVSGELYLAYSFTPEGGVKNIGVKKFNGTDFVQVGTEGIVPKPAEGNAVAVSSVYSLVFDTSGTPYVLYKAGDVANFMSVRKFDGSEWVAVGNTGFGQRQASIGWGPSLYFNDSGNPGIVYTLDRRNTTSAYANEVLYLDGAEWQSGTISGFPVYDSSTNDGIFYGGPVAKLNGKTYGFFTANKFGLYVYELSGNAWSTIVIDNFKAPGEEYMNPGNFQTAIKDGKILLMTTLQTVSMDQIYQFDGSALTPYGDTFPVAIGGTANAPEDVRFGVTSAGKIAVVKHDNDDFLMYSFMNEDLKWEDFVYLGTVTQATSEENPGETVTVHDVPACYGGSFSIAFDKNGNLLVIYPDTARKGAGFPLYSIGLEDDILPE